MSAFKGTPGPWSVGSEDADNGGIEVISEARPYVCLVLPGAIDGTTAANARLIAAAPELLEMLQTIEARWERNGWGYNEEVRERTRALIAKATGGDV